MTMQNDKGAEALEFDGLLNEVLHEENARSVSPAGLEQRLAARIAQEHQPPIWSSRPFAFAESISAKRSAASLWTAVGVHAAVIGLIAILIAAKVPIAAPVKNAMTALLEPPPPPVAIWGR
jgi:hypothetical protein